LRFRSVKNALAEDEGTTHKVNVEDGHPEIDQSPPRSPDSAQAREELQMEDEVVSASKSPERLSNGADSFLLADKIVKEQAHQPNL
jgi:hypothetical protein